MQIISLGRVERTIPQMEGARGVSKQVPLSRKDGAPNFSFRVFTLEPGGHTPFHQHPFEHMNYVIQGEGLLVSAEKESAIKEGDFALILPDEKHQFRNTSSTRDMVIICAVPKDYE